MNRKVTIVWTRIIGAAWLFIAGSLWGGWTISNPHASAAAWVAAILIAFVLVVAGNVIAFWK